MNTRLLRSARWAVPTITAGVLTASFVVAPGLASAAQSRPAASNDHWAGVVASMNKKSPNFAASQGEFTVPSVKCLSSGEQAVSVWVGIGGARTVHKDTLYQAGTRSECNNGQATYYAWTEWVGATNAGPEVRIATVNPGDHILVEIAKDSSAANYHATLIDNYGAWTYTADFPDQGPGFSAECIVERPRSLNTSAVLPLAEFDTPITFPSCRMYASDALSWPVNTKHRIPFDQTVYTMISSTSKHLLATTNPLTARQTPSTTTVTWRTSS